MTSELRFSRPLQYAVVILAELALDGSGQSIAIKALSSRTGVPEGSLRIVVQELVRSGLVTSASGKDGGVSLSMPACEITVGEISRVFEGETTASERLLALCALGGNAPSCSIWAWRLVADLVREQLNRITIDDLVREIKKKGLGKGGSADVK